MASRLNLIIDTDVGADDACTIAFALHDSIQAPSEVKIHGITTVFGNVSCRQSVLNVYALCQMYGQHEIPIFSGATRPLAYVFSAQWSGHGVRGMGMWPNPEEDVHDAIGYYATKSAKSQGASPASSTSITNNSSASTSTATTTTDHNSNATRFPFSYTTSQDKPLTLESKLIGVDPATIESEPESVRALYAIAAQRGHAITPGLDAYHNVITTHPTLPAVAAGAQETAETVEPGAETTEPGAETSPRSGNQEYVAAAHLVAMAAARPQFYDLLCLGPLTNVALALELDPDFLSNLKTFTWMGGGLVGNTTPFAEFNAYSDSRSAQIVLDCLAKIPLRCPKTKGCAENDKKLSALVVGWDACLTCSYDLAEFQSLFAKSTEFSWAKMALEDTAAATQSAAEATVITDVALSAEQPNENTNPAQTVTTSPATADFLTVYTCRQFFSKYESIIQTALEASQDGLTSIGYTPRDDDEDAATLPASPVPTQEGDASKKEDHDVQPAKMVICDLYAYLALAHPEMAIAEDLCEPMTCLSDVSSEFNGQTVVVDSTKTSGSDSAPLSKLQFVTAMNKAAVSKLIAQRTHGTPLTL